MKLHEIKQQQINLADLIRYCLTKNIDATWFNLLLLENHDIASKKVEQIDKLQNVSAISEFDTNLLRLLDKENEEIEKFNNELIESAESLEGAEKEEKLNQKKDVITFDEFLQSQPKEKIEKRKSLIAKYGAAMETDMSIDFAKLDREKFENMTIEKEDGKFEKPRFSMLETIKLNFFFDENNWKSPEIKKE